MHSGSMPMMMLSGEKQLGSSLAAAVVTAVLFFIVVVGAIANLAYTRYPFYNVVIVSAAFRCIAYGCRAAYLSHFRPALEGVFLAFSNAGYGVNLVVLHLVQASWCTHAVLTSMTAREQKFWRIASYVLIIPIICFGPIIGVVAAGYIFGDLNPHGQNVGSRLRSIATWGLWGCTMTFTLINARLFLASVTARKTSDGEVAVAAADRAVGNGSDASLPRHTQKQQPLIGVLGLLSLLLHVRALLNIVVLYPKKKYTEDHWWYPLSVLPELIVMFAMITPTLLARIALFWPRPPAAGRDLQKNTTEDV